MLRRLYILSILLITLCLFIGCGYNTMQRKEESVFKAWGDLESQLQRRLDLIPNLVEVVRGYAAHEKDTLEAVIEARARATSVQLSPESLSDPDAIAKFQAAQGSISSTLSRLMMVVENYPDLKANENFRDLQHQLEGTENRISVARQRYNKAVEDFNFSIRKFPNSITNSIMLNLERKEYFKAEEAAQAAPKVEF